MRFGLLSGILWGLDTVILGIGMTMAPYVGSAEAMAFASIVGSFLHDAFCAIWLLVYMGARHRLGDTLAALRTRSGKVVMLGALLGGPIGMTGYVIAIANLGAAYTAIISAFYPAFGAVLAFLLLKEKMGRGQIVALFVALFGVMAMGLFSAGDSQIVNAPIGLLGAALTVVGWGSEAVLCAWGMRDDNVDDETALHIRETTSALVYGIAVLPLFGAWGFASKAAPSAATSFIALAGLAGVASYLFYYRGISAIGAAKAMALNISYSAWAVVFGLLLLGTMPTPATVVCCVAIVAGTVLAASDWGELFGGRTAR
jgi:drug/metabolite transporter (DMT)-like permease